MTRYHVHMVIRDVRTDDEVASATFTVEADDDGEAQNLAWKFLDDDWFAGDVTEIEEADTMDNAGK